MLKKENSTFCYPCCNYRLYEPELSYELQEMACPKLKKEGKQSLKAASHRSSISNVDNITKGSLIPPNKSMLVQNQSIIEEKKKIRIKTEPTKSPFVYVDNRIALKGKVPVTIKANDENVGRKKVEDFTAKENQPTEKEKLQKHTASRSSSNANLHQFRLQPTKKQLRSSQGSLTLGKFRESVVSVQVSNDLPPQVEQSMVMIDYFNPPSQKKNQISSYLNSRQ